MHYGHYPLLLSLPLDSRFRFCCLQGTQFYGSPHYALSQICLAVLFQESTFDSVIYFAFIKSEDVLYFGLGGMLDNDNIGFNYFHTT